MAGENSARPDGPPELFKPDTFLETNANIKPSTSVPVALVKPPAAPVELRGPAGSCLGTLLFGKLLITVGWADSSCCSPTSSNRTGTRSPSCPPPPPESCTFTPVRFHLCRTSCPAFPPVSLSPSVAHYSALGSAALPQTLKNIST